MVPGTSRLVASTAWESVVSRLKSMPNATPDTEGLGLGDVKLAGTLGGLLGWIGWWNALYGLLTGFLLGGLVAAVLLLTRRADAGPTCRSARR